MSNVLAHVGSGGSGGAAANIYVTGLTDISEKLVPNGYTQLEYIESTGTQYIDTGIVPTKDYGFKAKVNIISASGDKAISVCQGNSARWGIGMNGTTWQIGHLCSTNGYVNSGTFTTGTVYNLEYNYENSLSFKVNSTTIYSNLNTDSVNIGCNLILFAFNNSNSIIYNSSIQLYSYQLYNDTTLVRNFIPCKNSSGIAGMYDTVGKTFYGSATSTAFTAGPEITYTTSCTMTSPSGKSSTGTWGTIPNPEGHNLPSGYTEVEYIQSSGTQYIDTGKKLLANDLSYEYEASYDSVSDEKCLFGNWGGSNCFLIGTLSSYWNNYYYVSSSYTNWKPTTLTANIIYSVKGAVSSSGVYTNLNGTDYTSSSVPTAYNADRAIQIFNNGNVSDLSLRGISAKLYYIKCSSNGTELFNLIPCIRDSDSAVGMYDLVSETFFGNSGTGTFTAGDALTMTGFTLHASEYGTHTVTASNGTKTSTEEVLVDALADYYVEMDYKLWLYKEGDECTDITGGWVHAYESNGASGTFTKYSDYMYAKSNGSSYGGSGISTANLIDVTNYDSIHYIISAWTDSYTSIGYTLDAALRSAYTTIESSTVYAGIGTKYANITPLPYEITVDVSSVSVSGFVTLTNAWRSQSFSVTNIWLE